MTETISKRKTITKPDDMTALERFSASDAPMTREEANAITDAIRQSLNDTWFLVYIAYERKAHAALGCTWEKYVRDQFHMTKQNAGYLVRQGKVHKALETASGVKTSFPLVSANQARKLEPRITTVAANVEALVATANMPPERAVSMVVEDELRAVKQNAKTAKAVKHEPIASADPAETMHTAMESATLAVSNAVPALKFADIPDAEREFVRQWFEQLEKDFEILRRIVHPDSYE